MKRVAKSSHPSVVSRLSVAGMSKASVLSSRSHAKCRCFQFPVGSPGSRRDSVYADVTGGTGADEYSTRELEATSAAAIVRPGTSGHKRLPRRAMSGDVPVICQCWL